jgi:PAS domain-containing protein
MNTQLKILILEDNPADVKLILRELNTAGLQFTSMVVDDREAFENALRNFNPTIILADHSIPQFNSIEALKLVSNSSGKFNVSIPVILVTGAVSDEFAILCMKSGAYDYILKDRLKRLPASITNALEKVTLERERARFLEKLIANEAMLEEVHKIARVGGWEVDLIDRKVTWSSITKELHEVPPNFIPDLEKGISFYKEGFSRQTISKAVNEGIANGTPWDLELQIITAKGNERWIRAIGAAEIRNGECIRLYGSFQDIHPRKQAQVALIETYNERNSILESIADGFFAVNKDWNVTYWNSVAVEKFRLSKEVTFGKNLWKVLGSEMSDTFFVIFQKAMTENVVSNFLEHLPFLDVWLDIKVYPSATGLSVYFQDITELKKRSQAIENRDKILLEIAWIQSHEVRAPLARIMGLIDLIDNPSDDDKTSQQEIIDHIAQSAKELDVLIRKIVRKTEQIDDEIEKL